MLFYSTDRINYMVVSLHEEKKIADVPFIQRAWEERFPDHFFSSYTMEAYFDLEAFYIIEDVMYQAFRIFAFLSIIIGCMGLYGLVSYLALQRKKEIGVRKTLGASVKQIVYLFSREFTVLVIVAYVVAAPAAYFAMQAWLTGFAYRIDLSLWFFGAALVASLLIAWLTVGYKSVQAAASNPVDSLRSE